jgi:type IX secretion system PorP/SprF family membrane protein
MLKFNTKIGSMKKAIFLSLILLASIDLKAQQDEQMSLYMYNPLYLNPAYAGSRDAVSMVGIGRFQWVNFKGAPMTQWFSVHSPLLHKSLGVGGHFVHDRIGDRVRTSGYADLSGSVQVNKRKDRLAAGISVGFDALSYDFTQSIVNDVNDPFYGQTLSVTKPNIGAGLYFHGEKHFIGISVPRLIQSKTIDANDILQTLNTRHYFITGGYVFDLNSVFKLKPSAMIKYTPGAPITADINISLLMYEKIWTGLMYRYHEAMGINVVYNIKNTFSVGYVYDFPINGLRTYQYGSHEVLLQYDIRRKQSTLTSPRYF